MKQRPILFSTPMVRAILNGRKSQTRRVITTGTAVCDSARISDLDFFSEHVRHDSSARNDVYLHVPHINNGESVHRVCPRVCVGDVLWVRETWAHDAPTLAACRQRREDGLQGGLPYGPYFRADAVHQNTGLRWRPSIHMPQWAARIWLRVTDVRIERLQEISEEDAEAEGMPTSSCPGVSVCGGPCNDCNPHPCRTKFRRIWDSINAKRGYGWGVNPWVVAAGFERIERPEGLGVTATTDEAEG